VREDSTRLRDKQAGAIAIYASQSPPARLRSPRVTGADEIMIWVMTSIGGAVPNIDASRWAGVVPMQMTGYRRAVIDRTSE